jgi:hypothetical protein
MKVRDSYDLLTDDPAYECSPASVNRVWSNPVPIEIEQLPDRVILRYEYMEDGLPQPGEPPRICIT